jgi:cysteine desulfurase / selenocysteine lyase
VLSLNVKRFEAARAQFPITKDYLYFDVANHNPLPTSVVRALEDFYREMQRSGGDKAAWAATEAAVRAQVGRLLHCEPGEIAFCKNTSEGLNIAANAIAWRPGDNVVVSEDEHPNIVYAWANLAARGVDVRFVRVDKPWIDADAVRPYVDRRTRALAVSHVSFHRGQRNDLASLASLCADHSAYLVVDAIQSLGILDIDVHALGISMLAAGGHKGLLIPHGLGVFYCDAGLIDQLHPAYLAHASVVPGESGDRDIIATMRLRSDARRFELGNPNYAGIHALRAALDLILDLDTRHIETYVLGMAAELRARLARLRISVLGPHEPEHCSNICTLALSGDDWAEYFRKSRIILSMRRGHVRVSLDFFNEPRDIERFVEIVERRL